MEAERVRLDLFETLKPTPSDIKVILLKKPYLLTLVNWGTTFQIYESTGGDILIKTTTFYSLALIGLYSYNNSKCI